MRQYLKMNKTILLGIVLIFLASFVSATDLDDAGLYFSFDDADLTGNEVHDLSGNYNATNQGATTGVAGVINEQFSYITNDRVILNFINGGDITTEDFFISFWVDFNDNGEALQAFVEKRDPAPNFDGYILYYANADNLFHVFMSDGTTLDITSSMGDLRGSEHHIVVSFDRDSITGLKVYLDGVLKTENDISARSGSLTNTNNMLIAEGIPAVGNSNLNGEIDEYGFWAGDPIDDGGCTVGNTCGGQVAKLFSKFNPYTPFDIFEITASNLLNGSSITIFNATINNGTDITEISTTNGSIFYTPNQIVNITIDSEDYFSRDFIEVNTSSNFDAEIYRAIINLRAINILDNSSIVNFNFTLDGLFNISSNNESTFFVNEGTYTYNGRAEGFPFNSTGLITVSLLENLTENITFSKNRFNITAKDLFTDTYLNEFSVRFINEDGSIDENISTISGAILFPASEELYELTIFAENYSSQSVFFNLTVAQLNHTFILFETDTVRFRIFDEITREEIATPVEFELYGSIFSTNGTYTGGDYILDEIPNDIYEIRYALNDSSYCQRSYFFFTPLRSEIETNLSLFVLDLNESFQFVRVVSDQNALPFDDGYLEIQRAYVSPVQSGFFYNTMEIANIGSDGNAVFCGIPNSQPYRFRILDESLLLVDIKLPSYLIDASSEITAKTAPELMETFYSSGSIVHSLVYQNSTMNYIFDYSDPNSVADQYCLEYNYAHNTITNTSKVCSTFNSGTLLLEIPNINGSYSISTYVFINDEKSILETDQITIGFDDSGIDVFGLLGAVLYLMIIIVCGTMGDFVNPTVPIIFALSATALFGLGFLGIFYITTPLIGGLLVVSIIILWLFKEGN